MKDFVKEALDEYTITNQYWQRPFNIDKLAPNIGVTIKKGWGYKDGI